MSEHRPGVPPRSRRPNLKDEVAGHLRDLILSGRLRPGDKINQDGIAAQLGVSKLPVREALITLETEGLVENVARRGAFVAQLTPDDVLDHYAIYGLLSGLAAQRAAANLSEDALDRLAAIIDRMEASEDAKEQEELNFRFHQTINKAGGSRRLISVLRLLSSNLPTRFFEFTTDWPDRAHTDHRQILRALRSRDGDAAAAAMGEHLRGGGEYAARTLRSAGFWSDGQADGRASHGAAAPGASRR